MNELQQDSWQAVFVLLWPILQQWMTSTKIRFFNWISPETKDSAKIMISGLAAALSTAGFHLAWMGEPGVGWHLTITIPPLVAIYHLIGAWVVQHHIYQFAVKNPALTKALLEKTDQMLQVQIQHLNVAKGDQ